MPEDAAATYGLEFKAKVDAGSIQAEVEKALQGAAKKFGGWLRDAVERALAGDLTGQKLVGGVQQHMEGRKSAYAAGLGAAARRAARPGQRLADLDAELRASWTRAEPSAALTDLAITQRRASGLAFAQSLRSRMTAGPDSWTADERASDIHYRGQIEREKAAAWKRTPEVRAARRMEEWTMEGQELAVLTGKTGTERQKAVASHVAGKMVAWTENLEKSSKAIGKWDKAWGSFSQGAFRRGGAQLFSAAFGDTALAKVTGGFAGSILSAVALPIGWKIGDAILNALPNILANAETLSVLKARGGQGMLGGETERRVLQTRAIFSEVPDSKEKLAAAWRPFQAVGIHPKESAEGAIRAMMVGNLEGVEPARIAEAEVKLRNEMTLEAGLAYIRTSEQAQQRMARRLGVDITRPYWKDVLEYRVRAGGRGLKESDFLDVMAGVAGSEEAKEALFAHGGALGKLRGIGGRLSDALATDAARRVLSDHEPIRKLVAGATGKQGDSGDLWALKQYQFTSGTGFAESMQTGWSGAPPMVDNTNAVKELTDAVKAETASRAGGGDSGQWGGWLSFAGGGVVQ
jgi:hypothetical protein